MLAAANSLTANTVQLAAGDAFIIIRMLMPTIGALEREHVRVPSHDGYKRFTTVSVLRSSRRGGPCWEPCHPTGRAIPKIAETTRLTAIAASPNNSTPSSIEYSKEALFIFDEPTYTCSSSRTTTFA